MKTNLYTLILTIFLLKAFSKTAEEWKSRTIYEIMTDRFSKGSGDTTPCSNLWDYCGGTFKGIEQNLDYIQGAGFNAIWISPVQPNSPRGYHGYAPIDFYGINPHFGTEQDFKDLIKACHERDIWVMVDTVANHIGFVQDDGKWEQTENNDYSSIIPFNETSYFHKYEIECHDAERRFPDDQPLLETCWLYYLPDLDQDVPFVRKTLLEWISWLVKTYDIDGLRLDALRHVSKPFWKEFSEAAGVFTLGEAWVPAIPFNAEYQKHVDSILNFPLYENIIDVFVNGKSMTLFSKYFTEASVHWKDMTVLANFVDCHDKARFLSFSGDLPAFKGSLAFVLSYLGIPIIYYGTEQAFNGGDDPSNREPLWTSMNPESEMYQFLKTINEFRKKTKFYEYDQIERLADDKMYAFSRGEYFFVFTNSVATETREISNHLYQDDTWLCNMFNNEDCVQVRDGKFSVSISNKNAKIFFPKPDDDSNKLKIDILRSIKEIVSSAIEQGLSRLS